MNIETMKSSSQQFNVKQKTLNELQSYFSNIKFEDHSLAHLDNKEYRSCELAHPNHYEYYPRVEQIILRYFSYINYHYFQYNLNDYLEIQLIRYTIGGNYKWHCDYGGREIGDDGVRKLSLSLQLSDPKEYEGGELEIIDWSGSHFNMDKEFGAAIIFDSKTPHKAHPVTSGTRLVLVSWAHGPELT